MKSLVTILLAVLFLSTNLVYGAVRRVPSQYPTVQAAINACLNGDTVLVAEGHYYENISFMGKAIIVASNFLIDADTTHISHTIIDGSLPPDPYSASVVSFNSGEDTTSVLCGFTITGGTGSAIGWRAGGGVLCSSRAKIIHNIIRDNSLTDTTGGVVAGGGIYCSGQYYVIEDNRIGSNHLVGEASAWGGGIVLNGCSGRIMGNTITENASQSRMGDALGGGVFCLTSPGLYVDVLISNNTIANNVLDISEPTTLLCGGGGVWAATAPQEITNPSLALRLTRNDISGNIVRSPSTCSGGGVLVAAVAESSVIDANTIIANRAYASLTRGGGLSLSYWLPAVTNNIIADNEAYYGAGLRIYDSSVRGRRISVINNTIVNNVGGSNIYSQRTDGVVMNTIVWSDSSYQEISVSEGLLRIVYSDVKYNWPDSGNTDLPPRFLDNTYRLSHYSQCIGAGTGSFQVGGVWYFAPARCIYGGTRPNPQGSRPDIGACEDSLAIPVGVEETSNLENPTTFALHQNYPNPFNPSTTIRFQLPTQAHVTLKVFDLLGREVAMLVNELKQPAAYSVQWNAGGMASGVYFYQLQSGSWVDVKKLILLR